MATLGYIGTPCAGGGHIHLDVSFNGGAAKRMFFTVDELRSPLSALTVEEREAVALLILKLHFNGMTRVQMRNELQAGVTVTI